jgi:hypothetical protein
LKPYDGEGFAGKALRERGGTVYRFDREQLRLERGGEFRAFPIAWLFGAGHFARTPVLSVDGRWVEHRLSWYAAPNRLSLTPGHSPQPSSSWEESVGVVQSEKNAVRCFGCHMTANRPGVHCESCHGAQGEHPVAKTIRRDRSVAACAGCHRSPLREYASPAPEMEDPLSVRFAPVGLTVSRCYVGSRRAKQPLDCVTCHDPHADAGPRASYDAQCLSCHVRRARAACPRGPECASCHMPKSTPLPYLTFTDHRIRKPV